jgi:arylsulfatase A-like enzyme
MHSNSSSVAPSSFSSKLLALLSCLFLPAVVGHSMAEATRPNIVFILADDLGYGDVQCLNPERGRIKTPHLDKLAAQGMVFTDAHSGAAVCTPTRYGLLTGRHAWRTRLQQGVLDGGNDDPLIAQDRLTVASFLKAEGYNTACVGKWHLGFQSEAAAQKSPAGKKKTANRGGLAVDSKIIGGPTTRGFDVFSGCSNARTMSSWIEGEVVTESLATMDVLPRVGDRAVRFLSEQVESAKSGGRFFLYLPLTSPHTPIVPTAEWKGKSGVGDYGDFVMQTDAVVGRVLAELDKSGLAENTLVIFTADNGCSPAAGTAALEKAGHFASGSHRGYKADIWDGGHRVPFLVRWPGKVKPGSKSGQLICLTDFFATCAAVLDKKLPESAAPDSVSILPALVGTESPAIHEAVVHHSIRGEFAVRQDRWKLCLCAGSGGWSKETTSNPQLYDLVADPGEKNNCAADHPEIVSKLSDLLRKYIADGRSTPGPAQKNDVAVKSPFETSKTKATTTKTKPARGNSEQAP